MQNFIYFQATPYHSQQICFPFMFTSTTACPIILLQEQTAISSETQKLQKFSSIPCKADMVSLQTEENKEESECRPPTKCHKIGRNHEIKEEDDEFKLSLTSNRGIVYKKKNTESNIINQVFSFLCTNKSRNPVLAFFNKDEQKVNNYYAIMNKVKQSNKKYINRKFLKNLMDPQSDCMLERAIAKVKSSKMQVNEVRKILRILIFHFLRDNAVMTLLTSSKIYKSTLPEHFWRKREILQFLFGTQN